MANSLHLVARGNRKCQAKEVSDGRGCTALPLPEHLGSAEKPQLALLHLWLSLTLAIAVQGGVLHGAMRKRPEAFEGGGPG